MISVDELVDTLVRARLVERIEEGIAFQIRIYALHKNDFNMFWEQTARQKLMEQGVDGEKLDFFRLAMNLMWDMAIQQGTEAN